MGELNIKTDHKWRSFLYCDSIPQDIMDEYDWLDEEDKIYGWINYKGHYYHVSDFLRSSGELLELGWSGYYSDSFFSGVVIELSNDGEEYRIGTYI